MSMNHARPSIGPAWRATKGIEAWTSSAPAAFTPAMTRSAGSGIENAAAPCTREGTVPTMKAVTDHQAGHAPLCASAFGAASRPNATAAGRNANARTR